MSPPAPERAWIAESAPGTRARLGVIVLSTSRMVEEELRRMVPVDVPYHVARCVIADASRNEGEKEAELLALERTVADAARAVAAARPELILFACTIGSLLGGPGRDGAIADEITRATGIPALTTGTAVLEALAFLRLRRVTLVSPYPEGIGQREKEHLEASLPGLCVVSMKHLGIVGSYEKNLLDAGVPLRAAREAFVPEADGLFLSCTAWPTLEVIEPLEREVGVPVVTSTQASLWAALRRCGIPDRLPFGRLFAV